MQRRTRFLLLWLYAGVLITPLVLLGSFLQSNWQSQMEEAQAALSRSAREVSVRVISQLLDASRVLDLAKAKLESKIQSGSLSQASAHKALHESVTFFDLNVHKHKFGILFCADKNGRIHAEDESPRDSGLNVTDRHYFISANTDPAQKWIVGDHVIGRTNGLATFHLATPLHDAKNNFQGIVYVQVPDDEFDDLNVYRTDAFPVSFLVFQKDGLVSLRIPPNGFCTAQNCEKQLYQLANRRPERSADILRLSSNASIDGNSYEIAYDKSPTFKTMVVAVLPTEFIFWHQYLPANTPLVIATFLSLLLISYLFRRLYVYLNRLESAEVSSLTDPLTCLCNRRSLDLDFPILWKNALRDGKPISVLFIDIDHFKVVNDNHGHEMGDRVLRAISGVIRENISRPLDLVCRWGGEEFVVVLPDTPVEGATHVAERIMNAVHEKPVFPSGDILRTGSHINVTVSIGIASMLVTKDDITEDLIDKADKAMLQAKAAGRNCYRVWKTSTNPR